MARMDEAIRKAVMDRLVGDDRVDNFKVNVEVSNGTVTLSGEVPTYFSKTSAYEDAQGVSEVVSVRNHLTVNHPSAIPTDAEIEKNLKAKFAVSPGFDLKDMEVTVSAGRVNLKGTVDIHWKKMRAQEIAAIQPGVVLIENHLAVVPTDDIYDKVIAYDIVKSLEARAAVDADDVNVRVREGDVTLTGSVPNWDARKAAEESASYTNGVKDVKNCLVVTHG